MSEQLSLISAILGGFSFTFLSSLLPQKDSRKIVDYTFAVAVLAASIFFICALGWGLITGKLSQGGDQLPPAMMEKHRFLSMLWMGGIFLLNMCLGMSGWIRSRRMGIVTTIISIIGLWLIIDVVKDFIN